MCSSACCVCLQNMHTYLFVCVAECCAVIDFCQGWVVTMLFDMITKYVIASRCTFHEWPFSSLPLLQCRLLQNMYCNRAAVFSLKGYYLCLLGNVVNSNLTALLLNTRYVLLISLARFSTHCLETLLYNIGVHAVPGCVAVHLSTSLRSRTDLLL